MLTGREEKVDFQMLTSASKVDVLSSHILFILIFKMADQTACVFIFHGDPGIVLGILTNIDIEFSEGPYTDNFFSLKFDSYLDASQALLLLRNVYPPLICILC